MVVLDLGCVCVCIHVRLGDGSEKAPPRKEWVGLGEGTQVGQVPPEWEEQEPRGKLPVKRLKVQPRREQGTKRGCKGKQAVPCGLDFHPKKSNWWSRVGIETGIGFWRGLS